MPHSFFIILLLFFPVLLMLVDTFLGILSYCFYYIFPFFSQFPSIPSNFQLTFIFFFYRKCLIRGSSGKIIKKPLFYAGYFFPEILYQNTLLGKPKNVLIDIKKMYSITSNKKILSKLRLEFDKYFFKIQL